MATELVIKDGVLLKCDTDQPTVTIPKEVQYVSDSAFESCPDVHIINLYPDYVISELTDTIFSILKKILKGWESDSYTPCLPIYHIDNEIIIASIESAIEKVKLNEGKWRFETLDCALIAKMAEARSKGGDNQSYFHVPTDESTSDYGVLYIPGINKDNYEQLGANFDYNLIRYYSLLGRQISLRWLVILGSSMRLEPADTYSAFSPDWCWMKNPVKYLEYMKSIGKLVE